MLLEEENMRASLKHFSTTTYKLEDTETVVKVSGEKKTECAFLHKQQADFFQNFQVQANGLLNIMVSSLVERQAVEPEGALGCEVSVRQLENTNTNTNTNWAPLAVRRESHK